MSITDRLKILKIFQKSKTNNNWIYTDTVARYIEINRERERENIGSIFMIGHKRNSES